jgi:mono/diheme cytochrome c family protein
MNPKFASSRASIIHLAVFVTIVSLPAGSWSAVPAHEGHRHAPASAKELKNPLIATDANLSEGKKEYNQNCASCHAEDGKAQLGFICPVTAKPADLTSTHVVALTDGEIFWEISHGIKVSGMPAFAAKTSALQRWQIVVYLRQLSSDQQSMSSMVYVCPMHPDVKSTAPGKCPKCGMKMVSYQAKGDAVDPR